MNMKEVRERERENYQPVSQVVRRKTRVLLKKKNMQTPALDCSFPACTACQYLSLPWVVLCTDNKRRTQRKAM